MDVDPVLDTDKPNLFEVLRETAILPIRLLLSKTALKTYLSTILFALTAFTLYLVAAATYIYFYNNYIPNTSFDIPIFLQFDHPPANADLSSLPYRPQAISGTTPLGSFSSLLVSQQSYDFTISLTLPRSPSNIDAGNFMLLLSLLGPATKTSSSDSLPDSLLANDVKSTPVIASSSRPTSLTYVSPQLELAKKVLALPMYLAGFRDETETISVSMLEGVSFDRGWRSIPKALAVEVKSRTRLQVYAAEVNVRARLGGFRYLMRNHRIASFVVFTTLFWAVELVTMVGFWAAAAVLVAVLKSGRGTKQSTNYKPPRVEASTVKEEEQEDDDADNMSDTSRTFPTFSQQPPLRYTSSGGARIKQEEGEISPEQMLPEAPTARSGLEADVSANTSDEDADFLFEEPGAFKRRSSGFDSGLGTSMESSAGSSSTRRRRTSGGRE